MRAPARKPFWLLRASNIGGGRTTVGGDQQLLRFELSLDLVVQITSDRSDRHNGSPSVADKNYNVCSGKNDHRVGEAKRHVTRSVLFSFSVRWRQTACWPTLQVAFRAHP